MPLKKSLIDRLPAKQKTAFSCQSVVVWGLISACSVPMAFAASNEWVLQMDTNLRTDSNPLRLADSASADPALAGLKKRDSILSADLRVAGIVPLDSPQTRLLLSGQLGKRDYRKLDQLDNQDASYRAALQWRLGSLWRGEVIHASQNQLYQSSDGGLTQKAMVRTDVNSAEVALKVSPQIEIPVTVARQTLKFDSLALAGNDRHETSVDGSVLWNSNLGSNLRGGLRSTQTQYLNRTDAQIAVLDSSYRDAELYVATDWQFSTLSRVGGQVGYVHRQYDHLGARNFSVPTAQMQASHDYSPMTRLTASLWSRPYGSTDTGTLYTLNTGGQLGVRWLVTPKTRLAVQATEEWQRYQSVVQGLSTSNPQIKRTRLSAGIDYAATPEMRLYANGFREKLDRTSLGAAIGQTGIRLGLEYTYENLTGSADRTGLRGNLLP